MRRRPSGPGPYPGNARLLRAGWATVAVVGIAVTAVVVSQPGLRASVHAPELRVVIEVVGLCLVLFAALVLALPADADVRPARNAFVSALAVLAVSNAVFALWPVLAHTRPEFDQGLAFYPWVTARYTAGLLFVLAGTERPRLRLGTTLALSLGLLAAIDVALVGAGLRLPVPVRILDAPGGVAVAVEGPWAHTVSQAVPGGLFILGSWLAGKLYLRSAAPAYLWLSLALLAQVFTQVHEIVSPAFLGPIVSSADGLRVLAFLLLACGALVQVRRLYRDRSHTVRLQEQELESREALVDELATFAEQEQDFRAIVSHELATPIASIRAFTHVLRAETTGARSPRLDEALRGIDTESRRLTELVARIDELRDLELDGFRCDLRPLRVRPLLEDAAAFLKGLPGAHPITVRCHDARIHADPVRLGQVLRNVLANAARYTPPGTPILLAGHLTDGDHYAVRVADRGPGIPATERRRVLRRYGRGRGSQGTGGQGLGLYVASGIVEAHGGSLHLKEATGGGTEVRMTLRLAR